jgi:catechol 2,3-dioxygenase
MSEIESNSEEIGKFFRPRRLGHVNLVVTDVDRSMDFYMNVVGLDEAYRRPQVMAGFLSNGNTHHDIGMVQSDGPLGYGRPAGLNHIAFELENEVDLVAGYNQAIAAGVSFERTADHDIAHSVYGADSDGNEYEIYADVIHEWRAARHGVVTKMKPNWTPGSTPPHAERNYHADPEIVRMDDAIFHPLRATHAVLAVDKFVQAFDTYHDIVGLTPLAGGRDAAFAVFGGTCDERNLALFHANGERQPGMHHVGFQLSDEADLDKSLKRLGDAGLAIESEFDHPARRGVFFRDIDGIRLQFYVDLDAGMDALRGCEVETALFLA